MLSEIKRHVAAGRSFAFETTLSGQAYVARIRRWRAEGYRVTLIRRRFASGWRNFRDVYRHEVDEWFWYDNSNSVPVLIEQGTRR